MFHHLATLSGLRNLRINFTGGDGDDDDDEGEVGMEYKQLDWESVKPLLQLTELEIFELSHPSLSQLDDEEILKFTEHWQHVKSLVIKDGEREEEYDEGSTDDDSDSDSDTESRCNIAILPELLNSMPSLEVLSMKFSDAIPDDDEFPQYFFRRKLRSVDLQNSFSHSSLCYVKELASFLTTLFKEGTTVTTGYDHAMWMMMYIFLHGEIPEVKADQIGEVKIPKRIKEVFSRRHPKASKFNRAVREFQFGLWGRRSDGSE